MDSAVQQTLEYLEESVKMQLPFVGRIRYTEAEDLSGESSLFFRVVLQDPIAHTEFSRAINAVQWVIRDLLDHPDMPLYFNYRTGAEQERMKDPEWE